MAIAHERVQPEEGDMLRFRALLMPADASTSPRRTPVQSAVPMASMPQARPSSIGL